jgi:pimeloyl-ACP methyl ester carboxylesterase
MRDLPILVEGGRINAWIREARGEAPTVVMVHGLTSTSRSWLRVIGFLPERYGVIALDVRGRGQSWQAPPPYGFAAIIEDIDRSIDVAAAKPVVIAGHSMGAWIVARYAASHPDRVERCVLVDGAISTMFDTSLPPTEIIEAAVGPALARLSLEFASPEDYFAWWQSHPSISGRWTEDLADILRYDIHEVGEGRWVSRVNRDAIVETGGETALDEEAATAWARLSMPTDFIVVDHGMFDQPGGFIPLRSAEEAAAANPNIRVHMIEGVNHYTVIWGDGAERVAAIITSDG